MKLEKITKYHIHTMIPMFMFTLAVWLELTWLLISKNAFSQTDPPSQ